MLKSLKLATPATAGRVASPESVPPPGFVPSATVTLPANPVAVLPKASRAATWTAGVIVAPALVLVGSTLNTSSAATPGAMLKAVLVPQAPPPPAAGGAPAPGR